ncbi:GGDEF domain-containing protein [Butyrivibrio sp. JL13D10]|uniref:GGDEF domain-containing protein n=1 Tax=Butyrivibrio sp. JL13D10 TaxID=3236815 RepID=UPI0038B5B859
MDKLIFKIYCLFFVIACLIVAVYAFISVGKTPKWPYLNNTGIAITSLNEQADSDNAYSVTLDSSEIINAGGCLSFSTTFTDTRVYSNEELIYESLGSYSLFMRSNGNIWHFINVANENHPIIVKLSPVYGDTSLSVPAFMAGDYYNLRSNLVIRSTPALLVSILDVLFGIGMVVFFLITRHIDPSNSRTLFLGLTAIMIGFWSMGETDAMIVILNNRTLAGVIAFLILIFIPVPYVLYIHDTLWADDKSIYRIPICLCLFDFLLVTGLAITGIMDLKQSVIFTHATWATGIIYVIAAAANTIKKARVRKNISSSESPKTQTNLPTVRLPLANESKEQQAIFNAGAMLIIVAVVGVEIIHYWTKARTQNDLLGRILLLLYIVVLAYRNIIESLKEIENGRMAEYYRKLANTDSMTGLSNRTPFNHDVEELRNMEEYSIISIDLNDLKRVNDTKGHQAGDSYITNAANIINEVFGQSGVCYRIGGDEFCVIIKEKESSSITKKLVTKMESRVKLHNEENPADPVAIALGYENKTSDDTRDYNEILHLADEKMYE